MGRALSPRGSRRHPGGCRHRPGRRQDADPPAAPGSRRSAEALDPRRLQRLRVRQPEQRPQRADRRAAGAVRLRLQGRRPGGSLRRARRSVGLREDSVETRRRHAVRFEPVEMEIEVFEDETVLEAAFRQGILLAHGCKEGQCSACKSFLLAGEVELERYSTFALADYEQQEGYTLLCRAHACSDLEVELLHYDEDMLTAGVPIRTLRTKVQSIQPLTHDIYKLSLALDGRDRLDFHAGQYVDIQIPGTGDKRSFSMCNTPAVADRLAVLGQT